MSGCRRVRTAQPSHGLPSLNINVTRDAENPAVVGGAAVAGNDPVPWVAWQELDGAGTGKNQIFVSRAVKQAASGTPCVGKPASGNANVNGFCWLQVGLDRLNPTTGASSPTGDPTLSVDPTRDGIEPDDAFTGPSDTVPWVVWYEQNPGLNGVDNELVFAAKAVPDASADGGFHWVAVGNGTAGQNNVLDTTGANQFGPCLASAVGARLLAQQGRDRRRRGSARRGRHAHAGRHDGAVGGLVGDDRCGTSRNLRLAPGRRRSLRGLQPGPADLEHAERRFAA